MSTKANIGFLFMELTAIIMGVTGQNNTEKRFILSGVDAASPYVFDPLFYLNTNPDLAKAGIHSPDAARSNWLSTGIKDGRQGCGSFHTKQYLERYPDLTRVFHSNYSAAVQHYLDHGIQEGRLGYMEGGYKDQYGQRWTISNRHGLFISASSRMGAAIDSVVWNNKEFINSVDHGRELQMACNADFFEGCFNPTEAGGRTDWIEPTTKTVINHVDVHENRLHTIVYPAFWMRPNTRHQRSQGCSHGSPALNTNETYYFPFEKTVTIGCAGHSNCIEYISKFTIGGQWPSGFRYIQMEAPTGYLAWDFTKAYNFNTSTHQIRDHTANSQPVVMASEDGKYAMGVYTPLGQDTDAPQYYGVFFFSQIKGFDMQTSKWNVVYRKRKPQNMKTFTYKTYICVGDLNIVGDCLTNVVTTYHHV